jgi:hypothetical protein
MEVPLRLNSFTPKDASNISKLRNQRKNECPGLGEGKVEQARKQCEGAMGSRERTQS